MANKGGVKMESDKHYAITDMDVNVPIFGDCVVRLAKIMVLPRYCVWTVEAGALDCVVETGDDLEALKAKYCVMEVNAL